MQNWKLTNIERQMVDSKIEEIQSILSYLSKEFNIEFALQLVRRNQINNLIDYRNIIRNDNLEIHIMEFFVKLLSEEIVRASEIPNMLHDGCSVFVCIDDSGRPEGLDANKWIEKNKAYVVKEIVNKGRGKKKQQFLKLNYSVIPEKYNFFEKERFTRLYLKSNLN